MAMAIITAVMFIAIVGAWAGFIAWRRTRRFALLMLAGLGLQILIALPASVLQGLFVIEGLNRHEWPLVMLVGTPFNMGGLTARATFELFVEPLEFLVGHRSATVLSNAPFYAFLLLGHIVLVSLAVAWLWRKGKRRAVYVPLWCALVLLNSMANIKWPWWGS